ncbi:MAG TPA: type II toxin-antitoxin system prevent-host-death family antitoxin [Chloroflexota bacterium]|nr:type II toxin-antitoxin system prevent-host-death family antitoxin [Chloroflexota bacterium]
MIWQIQEAKQRSRNVVERALHEGPQTVTRRGEPVVVVVPRDDFRHLRGEVPDFRDCLLSAPDIVALDIKREASRVGRVEL